MANGAQAFKNATQSIPNATLTAISFSSANYDTNAYWAGGAPTRLTVPVTLAGQYIITANVSWFSNATGPRETQIRKNGANILGDVIGPAEAGGACAQSLSVIAVLAAGDYIELMVSQTSTAALNTASVSPYTPTLSLSFLGS